MSDRLIGLSKYCCTIARAMTSAKRGGTALPIRRHCVRKSPHSVYESSKVWILLISGILRNLLVQWNGPMLLEWLAWIVQDGRSGDSLSRNDQYLDLQRNTGSG